MQTIEDNNTRYSWTVRKVKINTTKAICKSPVFLLLFIDFDIEAGNLNDSKLLLTPRLQVNLNNDLLMQRCQTQIHNGPSFKTCTKLKANIDVYWGEKKRSSYTTVTFFMNHKKRLYKKKIGRYWCYSSLAYRDTCNATPGWA